MSYGLLIYFFLISKPVTTSIDLGWKRDKLGELPGPGRIGHSKIQFDYGFEGSGTPMIFPEGKWTERYYINEYHFGGKFDHADFALEYGATRSGKLRLMWVLPLKRLQENPPETLAKTNYGSLINAAARAGFGIPINAISKKLLRQLRRREGYAFYALGPPQMEFRMRYWFTDRDGGLSMMYELDAEHYRQIYDKVGFPFNEGTYTPDFGIPYPVTSEEAKAARLQ